MCASSFVKRFLAAAIVAAGIYGFVSAPQAQNIIIPGGGGNANTNFTATNIIHFASTNYFVDETGIQALITVVRDGPTTNGDFVTIDFTMLDGTAISGIHYYKQSGTLTFIPGQNR